MAEPEQDAAADMRTRSDPTIMIFLALFTLLLAFFILFNGVATREAGKTEALMRSLSVTFGPPGRDAAPNDPLAFARDAFRLELGGLLQRTLPGAMLRADQRNGGVVASVPTARLFRDGIAEPHSKSRDLLAGLAALLAAGARGQRLEMEALIGAGRTLPAGGDGLSVRRAGMLARELSRLGAPAEAVTVGLRPGDPDAVDLVFHLEPRAEAAR